MFFTLDFLALFLLVLYLLWPVLFLLIAIIVFLSWRVGRCEGWDFTKSLYFGFITATTVGYGYVHPTRPRTRYLSVLIAMVGLLLTGIIVAAAIGALTDVITDSERYDMFRELFKDLLPDH